MSSGPKCACLLIWNWCNRKFVKLCKLNDIIHAKSLEICLGHSEHSPKIRLLVLNHWNVLRKKVWGWTHRGRSCRGIQVTNLLSHLPSTSSLPLESYSGITHPADRSAKLFSCCWSLNSSLWPLSAEQRRSGAANKQLCILLSRQAGEQGASWLQRTAGTGWAEQTVLLLAASLTYSS